MKYLTKNILSCNNNTNDLHCIDTYFYNGFIYPFNINYTDKNKTSNTEERDDEYFLILKIH